MEIFNLENIAITSTTLKEIKDCLKKELLSNPAPKLWVTFNLDFFRISSRNNYFHKICKYADNILPDGNGIVHLVKAYSGKKIKRITGNDILELVLDLSKCINIRAAFVGGLPEVINKLESKIRQDFPELDIVLAVSPPLLFEKDSNYNKELIKKLKKSKPDILFLAIGCPRQEVWLYENMNEIGAKINIGVGAALDFFTGIKKRSPQLFQNLSLEWLWRLLMEPKRLTKRYLLHDLPFFVKKFYQYKVHNAKN